MMMERTVVFIVVMIILIFGLSALRKHLNFRFQLLLAVLAFIGGGVYGSISPSALVLPFDIPFPFFEWERKLWHPVGIIDIFWIIGLTFGKLLVVGLFILMSSEDLDPFARTPLATDRGDNWDKSSTVIWFLAVLAATTSSGAFFIRMFV